MEIRKDMKVLVIDDNEVLARMLTRMLETKGHKCIVSNDGRNGLALLQEKKFDATILDLSMPEFTGLDIINELDKSGKLKEEKIIVLTATNISNEDIKELKKRGIYACLQKPVKIDLLIETLKN